MTTLLLKNAEEGGEGE